MKKVYISGKIAGLSHEEVVKRFSAAEKLLRERGYEPVKPILSIPDEKTLEEAMLADLAVLMNCDAIFMLDGWMNTKGACIEKYVAEITGKIVRFETAVLNDPYYDIVHRITQAIEEIMGLRIEEYSGMSKSPRMHYARIIFVDYCCKHGMNYTSIGKYLNRDRSTISRDYMQGCSEVRVNPDFANMAIRVDNLLRQQT